MAILERPESAVRIAARMVQMKDELQRQRNELAAVLRISQALSHMTSLDDLIRETLEVSLATLDARAGAFYLYDEKRRKLVFSYVINSDNPEAATVLIGRTLDPGQGIAGQVFLTGMPSIDDDPTRHTGHMREIGESTGYLTRNMVTLPLISMQGKTLGVMQALNKTGGNFDREDLELLTIMAAHAVNAIVNARLNEEARAASIMHYLGDISHDIKNLMTPAQSGAQTLESILAGTFEDLDRVLGEQDVSDGPIAPKVGEAVDVLRALYPEMIEMVNDSINSAQERVREIADAVKGVIAEPYFEPYCVNELIRSVTKTLGRVAEQRGITLRTDELGEIPPILVDKKRLYSAVYNLVNNAIPETPSGGHITARTHAAREGGFPEGGYVQIEIADTGRGMPDEVKSRLFSANAISTKPGGTGLGTRIVKNVVDAHGGVLWVESEPDVGTTFYVKLPCRTADGLID